MNDLLEHFKQEKQNLQDALSEDLTRLAENLNTRQNKAANNERAGLLEGFYDDHDTPFSREDLEELICNAFMGGMKFGIKYTVLEGFNPAYHKFANHLDGYCSNFFGKISDI